MENREEKREAGVGFDCAGFDMAEFPSRVFSFADIKRASKLLAEDIDVGRARDEDVMRAFQIAHNWRLSHAYPMIAERIRLAKIAKGGIVTAGRVKRMTSIRKKLRRGSTDLRAMQDLGGCRAVMRDLSEVYRVVHAYEAGASKTNLSRVTDYMLAPKNDGYRGVHLICKFGGSTKGETYDGQSLEIQVRTATQHVWATAIETVGAIRNEDLKAGRGDPQWLRLMALMGHYLALHDGLDLHGDFRSARELCAEISHLAAVTQAIEVLETFQAIVRAPLGFGAGGSVYELFFDAESGRVEAVSHSWASLGGGKDMGIESESSQHVIVNVDRIADLRAAFPNFYLDISAFRGHLEEAMVRSAGRRIARRQLRVRSAAGVDLPIFRRQ